MEKFSFRLKSFTEQFFFIKFDKKLFFILSSLTFPDKKVPSGFSPLYKVYLTFLSFLFHCSLLFKLFKKSERNEEVMKLAE